MKVLVRAAWSYASTLAWAVASSPTKNIIIIMREAKMIDKCIRDNCSIVCHPELSPFIELHIYTYAFYGRDG